MANQNLKINITAKDRSKQALNSVQGSLNRLKNSVFNLQNAFIGLGAGLAIRSLVNTGKQIEGLQVRLKFLFGTAEEGAKAFDKMAKFASKVPFSLEEIQRGSGVLAVVSKDAEELANLMEITGNVAAVTGLDFKTTAEQIQRSMSAGISAADLFRDRGVKAMLGFKAGAVVTVEETADAFQNMFGKNGKYGKATDELAKTFEGTLSMIGDKWFNLKRVMLDNGFFEGLKKEFSSLDKAIEENSDSLERLAVNIGTLLASAVKGIADSMRWIAEHSESIKTAFKAIIALKIGAMFVKWAKALRGVYVAMTGLVALSGVGLINVGLAVAAATAAYIAMGKVIDELGEKADKNNDKMIMGNIPDRNRGSQYEPPILKTKLYQNNLKDLHSGMRIVLTDMEKLSKTFKEINQESLYEMQRQFENIAMIVKNNVNKVVTDLSNIISRSVVYAESLGDAMLNLARNISSRVLAFFIELVARQAYSLFMEKAKNWELMKQLGIEKLITAEKKAQGAARSSGSAFSSLLSFGSSLFGKRESGGSVAQGKPYMVGERGPELFVPNQSGQIQQSARGGNGGGTTVNFNINTVDARGFDELLTESRGTITALINQAVNERGSRSIV